ncbi:MAG: hypothetical protein AB4352_21755 [Hormoscilla sp.]
MACVVMLLLVVMLMQPEQVIASDCINTEFKLLNGASKDVILHQGFDYKTLACDNLMPIDTIVREYNCQFQLQVPAEKQQTQHNLCPVRSQLMTTFSYAQYGDGIVECKLSECPKSFTKPDLITTEIIEIQTIILEPRDRTFVAHPLGQDNNKGSTGQ